MDKGKIKVTGADRVEFLHNILTNDIKILKPGDSCLAALLSPTAKVLALVDVLMLEDSILLATEPGFEKKTIELLEKFVITEDVKFQCHPRTILSGDLSATESSDGSAAKYGGDSRLKTCGNDTLGEVERIEKGILRYGIDVTEEVTLPETGLEEIAASETKGCYPGQEVVARTKTYGGLQRKMAGIVIEEQKIGDSPRKGGQSPIFPSGGDGIFAGGKEIGRVTSACYSPRLKKAIALGYVRKGFFEKPSEVEIQTKAGQIKAVTTKLPFS